VRKCVNVSFLNNSNNNNNNNCCCIYNMVIATDAHGSVITIVTA